MTNADQLYEELEGLINQACHHHLVKYGGDFEELKAVANLIFPQAIEAYNPQHGTKIQSWVMLQIERGLLMMLRKQMRDTANASAYAEAKVYAGATHEDHHEKWIDLQDGLSAHADYLLKLCTDTPPNLKEQLSKQTFPNRSADAVIRQWLTRANWTLKQIKESFDEIRKALQ